MTSVDRLVQRNVIITVANNVRGSEEVGTSRTEMVAEVEFKGGRSNN
jgi:hypothetical protein